MPLSLYFLLLFARSALSFDLPENFLVPGKTVNARIDPQKTDTYFVRMLPGQFSSIRLTEKEVRLYATVYDPQDSLIQLIDENRMGGKEIISIFSKKKGDYKIRVGWNFSKPYSGNYSITLDRLEATGKTPALKAGQLMEGWYENQEPGAAVAVIRDGQPVFVATRGMANLEEKIPITSQSVFELASCSKQFTGLAVAILIDQKKLSLEEDIRTYLPEMPDYGEKITVGHLVYHTSGIRNTDALEMAGFTPEDRITLPMCVKFAANQKSLKFKPGERFNYSNTNYNLLAEIVARVTGQSFSAWTREHMFKPLGMHSTFFKENPGEIYKYKVLSYQSGREGFRQRPNNWAAAGSSALCTNIDDLVKWVNGFDTKSLITPGVEQLLYAEGSLREDGRTRYAFGNEFRTFDGIREIMHLGLVIGYRTAIVRYPERKLAFIFLSNDDNDAAYQRIPKIRDLFLFGDLRETKPNLKNFPSAETVIKNIEADEKYQEAIDLKPYEGVYCSEEVSAVWNLKKNQERLEIRHPRMDPMLLKNTGPDQFGFIEFSRNESGVVKGLKIRDEGIEFMKMK
ncbi:MAG TPA: serine hydrolase domain-containing protein [Saprospiraceae bacterium]|nr:serine hydrolase domain-containing protein [Saprospiraceae bacterium]HNT20983.1 serine hydrolase domain-containing protein [Saprospiraceae bacterium]